MKQSKFSKIIIAVIFSLFFAGNALAYVDVIEDAEASQYRTTVIGENNAVANSPQIIIVERCTVAITHAKRDVYVSDHTFEGEVLDHQEAYEVKSLTNCKLLGDPIANSTTGYITGIAGPVIQGAAITGGAYLMGNGIANSGDNTSLSNDSSSKSKAKSGSRSGSSSNSEAQGGRGGRGGNGGTGCRGNCAPNFD